MHYKELFNIDLMWRALYRYAEWCITCNIMCIIYQCGCNAVEWTNGKIIRQRASRRRDEEIIVMPVYNYTCGEKSERKKEMTEFNGCK